MVTVNPHQSGLCFCKLVLWVGLMNNPPALFKPKDAKIEQCVVPT